MKKITNTDVSGHSNRLPKSKNTKTISGKGLAFIFLQLQLQSHLIQNLLGIFWWVIFTLKDYYQKNISGKNPALVRFEVS